MIDELSLFNPQEELAMALIESARDEYNTFIELLDIESKAIQYEINGTINESYVLMEAEVFKNIVNKIKVLLEELLDKIKLLISKLSMKIKSMANNDITLSRICASYVNTYGSAELDRVKLEGFRIPVFNNIEEFYNRGKFLGLNFGATAKLWQGNMPDTVNKFLSSYLSGQKGNSPSININEVTPSNFEEAYIDILFHEKKDITTLDIGGYNQICLNLVKFKNNKIPSIITEAEKQIKRYVSMASAEYNKAKSVLNDVAINHAKLQYDCAKAYRTAILVVLKGIIKVINLEYKQNKAALIKMVQFIHRQR